MGKKIFINKIRIDEKGRKKDRNIRKKEEKQ